MNNNCPYSLPLPIFSRMNFKIKKYFIFLSVVFIFTGCNEMNTVENVSIKSNGDITFVTRVIISGKTPNVEFEGFIKKTALNFKKKLESEGWQTQVRLVSTSIPYTLEFIGNGNILKMINSTNSLSYFSFVKISDEKYKVFFHCTLKDFNNSKGNDYPFQREIRFQSSLGNAEIIDEFGEKPFGFQNVTHNTTFTINLPSSRNPLTRLLQRSAKNRAR